MVNQNVWDQIFNKDGHVFREIHPAVPGFVKLLHETGGNTVLDLGCGTGRHVVFLAQQGCRVFGFDLAAEGLKLTKEWLNEEKLEAGLHRQNMYESFPYQDGFFDGAISIQVIHHGRLQQVRQAVGELLRVVKPGGILLVTVPLVSRSRYPYEEIEPDTFVPLDGFEKGLPHHIFSPQDFKSLFEGCEILDYYRDDDVHQAILARKR